MNGLTARAALDDLALAPGSSLAVTGAPGAVGGYAIQLAKADGLDVVADAGPSDGELVRTLGADLVLPRGDDFAARVRDAFPDGVDGLVDAALLEALAVDAVRDGGGMATLRGYTGGDDRHRGVRFYPVYVRNHAREHAMLDGLRSLAEAGSLSLRVARAMPAAQAAEAHRILESGGTRGRLVLEF
jgi:NADPH:quinone reductase-like Zn-dependent oxidoreductase